MKKILSFDIAVILCVLTFCVLVWLPTRFLPYHWDAAGYIATEAHSLLTSHFWPLTTRYSDFSHPPLFPVTLALLWQWFGPSRVVSHLLLLPFLPIAMISVYYLIKKFLNRELAVIGTFLIGTTPVLLAEYGNVYPDLPSAALVLGALALWVWGKKWPAIIVFTLAVLFKEAALLFLPFFLLYVPNLKSRTVTFYLPLALPVLILCVWFVYHYLNAGWVFVQPGRPLVTLGSISDIYQSLFYVIWEIAIAQNRWLFTILGLISLATYLYKRKQISQPPPQAVALLSVLALFIAFYVVGGEYAMRYGLAVIALFYILILSISQAALAELKPTHPTVILLIIGVTGIMGNILMWHPQKAPANTYDFRPPVDLSYADMVNVFRQLGYYSQVENNNPQWYGAFPENLYLSQPYLEYVEKPVPVALCHQFALNPSVRQLIVYHPYSPGQIECQELLQKVAVKPFRRLSQGDKWAEIYEVTATQSARPLNSSQP